MANSVSLDTALDAISKRTKHELVPLLVHEEFPMISQTLLQVPLHIYVIFEYDDNFIVTICNPA
jgi:hypothetical protein